jgi:ubiquinone/menaquinone biosynthesis C-methylase UbiE
MQIEKEYVMDVYNQIASSFDNTRGKNYWATVSNFIQNIKDAQLNILDLGCGNGKYIPLFKPSHKVYALDNSEELLKIVNQRYPHIQTSNSDVTNTGFESNSFDHVISVAVIHHLNTLERRIQMIQEIYRILKINGTGLISAWATTALTNKFISFNSFNSFNSLNNNSQSQSDYLVPWDNQFNRFYHLFSSNEFEELIEKAGLEDKVNIVLKLFELDNYVIVIKKLK